MLLAGAEKLNFMRAKVLAKSTKENELDHHVQLAKKFSTGLFTLTELRDNKLLSCPSLMDLLGLQEQGDWFDKEFLPCVWFQTAGVVGEDLAIGEDWPSVQLPLQEILRQTMYLENELVRDKANLAEKRQKLQKQLHHVSEADRKRTERMQRNAHKIVMKKYEEKEKRPGFLSRRNQLNRARKNISKFKLKVERPEEKGLPEAPVEVSCHVFFHSS